MTMTVRFERLAQTDNMLIDTVREIAFVLTGSEELEPKKDSLTESQKQDAPSK